MSGPAIVAPESVKRVAPRSVRSPSIAGSPPFTRGSPPRTRSRGPSTRRERITVVAFLVFIATLPLEWITVTGAGGGFIKPFHVSALVFIAACLARWRPAALLGPVLRRHAWVYGSYFVVLALAFASGLAFADPYLSRTLLVRQLFYVSASIFIAGFLALAVGGRPQRGIVWSGCLAAVVLVGGLSVALAAQHTNPITVIGDALAQVNPDIITYRLLRSAFRTNDDLADTAASLRHKVFLALLVAVFLGLACASIVDKRRRLTRAALIAGSVLGLVMVVLSLSRSTILCLALTLLLVPIRFVVRRRAQYSQLAAVVVMAGVVLIVALSPVGDLLWTRFTSATSYESRISAAGPSFLDEFEHAAVVGAHAASVEKSPHNLVLHSWLSGGIIAAIAAAVMLLTFARLWLREVWRYVRGAPGWVLPVGQLWMLGIGIIPLVRAFTSGNQFHMVEWTAIGVFLGLTLANERAEARRRRPASSYR